MTHVRTPTADKMVTAEKVTESFYPQIRIQWRVRKILGKYIRGENLANDGNLMRAKKVLSDWSIDLWMKTISIQKELF